jgi:hypothetical protein
MIGSVMLIPVHCLLSQNETTHRLTYACRVAYRTVCTRLVRRHHARAAMQRVWKFGIFYGLDLPGGYHATRPED